MTDKQIIKLKPSEDLNEKIIKEKGNTKCIFYTDDICRNGDKTRDCVNCARVEYNSLYSLNWDNQERLQKIIKHKEQECEELKFQNKRLNELALYWHKRFFEVGRSELKLKQSLTEIKEIAITGLEGFCPKCSRKECEDNNCIETAIRDILQKINEVENDK